MMPWMSQAKRVGLIWPGAFIQFTIGLSSAASRLMLPERSRQRRSLVLGIPQVIGLSPYLFFLNVPA